MADRINTKKYPGVFYREVQGTHNGRQDRSFCYCLNYNGKKKWVTVGLASEGVTAESAYEARLRMMASLQIEDTSPMAQDQRAFTLGQAYEAWLLWATGEGHHTSQEIIRYEAHVKARFGDLPLDKLTLGDLDQFKASLMGKMSASSASKVLALMRVVINFSVKRRLWVGINPLANSGGFTMPKVDNKGERFLSPAEANRLLDELEKRSQVWHDMAFVALNTGMRLTELIHLTGRDINEDTKTAIIRAKGGQREPVLLTPDALEVLLRNRGRLDAPIFRDKNGDGILKATYAFNGSIKACGFNKGVTDRRHKVWFHTLRHTFASWLAQSGVDIYSLMRLMRHKKIEMTMRYAHLIPDRQREHLAVIHDILASGASK